MGGASGRLTLESQVQQLKRRQEMGDRGSKKDKEKLIRQKQQKTQKKKEQQKVKIPTQRPA